MVGQPWNQGATITPTGTPASASVEIASADPRAGSCAAREADKIVVERRDRDKHPGRVMLGQFTKQVRRLASRGGSW